MKLKADLPLDDKRSAALRQIDEIAEAVAGRRAAMAAIYAEKRALANKILNLHKKPPDWLVEEANSKGVSIETLCQRALDKAKAEKAQTLAYESLRQRAKADIRAAMSEQAIEQAVMRFRGGSGLG